MIKGTYFLLQDEKSFATAFSLQDEYGLPTVTIEINPWTSCICSQVDEILYIPM